MVAFIFLLILSNLLINPVLSQTIQTHQSDFSYNLDTYNQSYTQYLEKKQINFQYNSLATEKELLDTIKICLNARNNLIISYINLISSELELYKQADYQESTQIIQNALFQDSLWLQNQNTLVNNIANRDQLSDYNNQFVKAYQQTKANISQARSQYHFNHQYQLTLDITSFLADLDISDQNQSWLDDINSQLNSVLNNLSQTYKSTKSGNNQYNTFTDFYPDIKSDLDVSFGNIAKIIEDIESFYKKFY